jgi:hypothetical protein
MHLVRVLACAALLSVSGCGGGGGDDGGAGGGGGSSTISLSVPSLRFTMEGTQPPPPQSVTVTFNGAGVVAGFAPGVQAPPWLSVSAPSVSNSPVTFSISVMPLASLPFGTHTSSVRFVTGTSLSNPTGFVDMTVTFIYSEPFNVLSNPFPLAFSELAGNPDPPTPASGQLQIQGAGIPWRVTTNQPWISVHPTSGTGPATVMINLARPTLGPGIHNGEIQVIDERNGFAIRNFVTYTVTAAKLVLNRATVTFDIGPQTDVAGTTAAIVMSDELQGRSNLGDLTWQAASTAPWLQLSSTSGRTVASPNLVLSIPRAQLETLPPGFRSANIAITATDRTGHVHHVDMPVNLILRLPFVRSITPSAIEAGSSLPLRLSTEGATVEHFANLRVGSLTPQNIHQQFVGDFEVLFDMTAVPLGEHLVSFENALELQRSNATLASRALDTPPDGELVSNGVKSKLLFDRKRARLFAIDPGANEIERFQWNGAVWATLPSVAVAGLVDAELERSGFGLVILTDGALLRLPHDGDNPPLEVLHTLADRTCGRSFFRVGVPDDEQAVLTLTEGCSGDGERPPIFDLIRRQLLDVELPALPPSMIIATSDGFRAFVGASEGHPFLARVLQFDSPSEIFSQINLQSVPPTVRALDVDGIANKLLINNDTMFETTQDQRTPVPPGRVMRITRDGSRAYSYLHPPSGSRRIAVLDLDSNSLPLPEIGSIPVTVDLGDAQRHPDVSVPDTVAMTLAAEDQVLFVSGPQRIAVMRLP